LTACFSSWRDPKTDPLWNVGRPAAPSIWSAAQLVAGMLDLKSFSLPAVSSSHVAGRAFDVGSARRRHLQNLPYLR
jgi:hypothetical protein